MSVVKRPLVCPTCPKASTYTNRKENTPSINLFPFSSTLNILLTVHRIILNFITNHQYILSHP